jgi:oxygen-independent coproporphyrinogen-3 oxidase
MSPAGLYIHIPFCLQKCNYCNFYSILPSSDLESFIKALLKELSLYSNKFKCFDTIYIGGGTPSILSVQIIAEILKAVRADYLILPETEVTIEVNPGDAGVDYLESLRCLGVNRLNIGIQSFDDAILRFLGRRHNELQAVDAIENAFAVGFDNINLDLIYGIPNQTLGMWRETLDRALSFVPHHLSCYQLTLEPDTPLGRQHLENLFELPGEIEQAEFFFRTSEFLEKAGYIHYEVSNFAGSASLLSRHNQKYWQHQPYLGIGPSAHSFHEGKRWWNHRSVGRYVDALLNGEAPIEDSEILSLRQLRIEALFLGFRTSKGIDLSDFDEKYRYDLLDRKRDVLKRLAAAGLIEIRACHIRPTRGGLAVADQLALI